jgi:predicted oxidoreductase (fatty acid repression mutant protein)
MFDYEEAMIVANAMNKYGGSFVRSLGTCLSHADSDNTRRIKEAFPEYWETYRAWGVVDRNFDGLVERSQR